MRTPDRLARLAERVDMNERAELVIKRELERDDINETQKAALNDHLRRLRYLIDDLFARLRVEQHASVDRDMIL